MDIKKLKYDFSMLCAAMDFFRDPPEDADSPTFDMRVYMMEKFESYYHYFSHLHNDRWESLKELGKE